ncbi:Dehydrodolichyl diphosphate syntase complex subunit DHDDS [Smittium culicis]|uniref:Alkyl transferase n=1 Tax=Smittium culicis TaxID=133412 RepID=A0A1R1XPV6_9FUNG|nr:Dehydrodolichyl diphosphate syntase complex subunit DHDDS [Smittium culicis]
MSTSEFGALAGFKNYLGKAFDEFSISVLKQGPVPKHIGFIMDGNRRFAKARNMAPKEGHFAGFISLKNILEWCLKLGVQAVSVYAFSIDNFNRPKDEVEALMELTKQKVCELSENIDFIENHQLRIRVVGRLELLPTDVKEMMYQVNKKTENNKGPVLNICIPYLSTDEISTAVSKIAFKLNKKEIKKNELNEQLIETTLASIADCPSLDLLVRTSGETRLSNFMLWQVSRGALVKFTSVNWPEFSFSTLLGIILDYQLTKLGFV